jgi:hypothetical protein
MKLVKNLLKIVLLCICIFQIVDCFQVRTKMRKNTLGTNSKYKFEYHSHEFGVPPSAVQGALNNQSEAESQKASNGTDVPAFNICGNKTAGNATAKNGSSGNDCTDGMGRNKTNSPNIKVDNKAAVPIKVSNCNDVVFITGADNLSNYDDCSSKIPGFFTMSAYMVNYFATNNPSSLIKSIYIDDMNTLPSFVAGTASKCINFSDSKSLGRFAICFDDPVITASLMTAFMNFMKCRMGDSLKILTLAQMKRVYELSCNGQPIDPQMLLGGDPGALAAATTANMQLNPYYNIAFPPGGRPQLKPWQKLNAQGNVVNKDGTNTR